MFQKRVSETRSYVFRSRLEQHRFSVDFSGRLIASQVRYEFSTAILRIKVGVKLFL